MEPTWGCDVSVTLPRAVTGTVDHPLGSSGECFRGEGDSKSHLVGWGGGSRPPGMSNGRGHGVQIELLSV
jgi:hypothetical protein